MRPLCPCAMPHGTSACQVRCVAVLRGCLSPQSTLKYCPHQLPFVLITHLLSRHACLTQQMQVYSLLAPRSAVCTCTHGHAESPSTTNATVRPSSYVLCCCAEYTPEGAFQGPEALLAVLFTYSNIDLAQTSWIMKVGLLVSAS